MAEGTSENLSPPKSPGIIRKIMEAVKESLPWDPIGKKKRSIRTIPDEEFRSVTEAARRSQIREGIRILPSDTEVLRPITPEHEENTLPDLGQNIRASEQFIKAIRNPGLYEQDPYDPSQMKSRLGFVVRKPVENGWFRPAELVRTAMDRYQLPLAIYISHNHAKLVVGSSGTPEGIKLKIYDPMSKGFDEADTKFDATRSPIGVWANFLAQQKVYNGEYDITKFFEGPEFARYRDLLKEVKAFNFQNDAQNCIPYCLFVSAMLHGLEPGNTEFKRQGIRQFQEDFGVKIMTREEILPKPRARVRIIG